MRPELRRKRVVDGRSLAIAAFGFNNPGSVIVLVTDMHGARNLLHIAVP